MINQIFKTPFLLALMALSFLYHSKAFSFDTSINGFGSAYYGQALTSDLLPASFVDQHVDFTHFSLIGLNVGSKIGSHLGAAMQIVGLGTPVGSSDSFALIAQWAYLTYDSGNGTFLKVGRQLFPVYLASEYARVAFLTPFRTIPTPVGNLTPFTRFDGASVNQTFDLGLGKLTVGLFGGTPILDTPSPTTFPFAGSTFYMADLAGAQATWDGDGYRIRALASRLYNQFNFDFTKSSYSGHSQTFSLGYRIDKYNIVSWGEYALNRTPDGTQMGGPFFSPDRYSGNGHLYYLLGGYRIGNFLPRYTFSQGSSTYGIVDANITVHTFGVNYQIDPQAIIKAEYEKTLLSAPGMAKGVLKPQDSTATTAEAIYAGVDFIF